MGFWPSVAVFFIAWFVIGAIVSVTTGLHVGVFTGIAGAGLVTWAVRHRFKR